MEDVLELDPLDHAGGAVDVEVDLRDVGPEDRRQPLDGGLSGGHWCLAGLSRHSYDRHRLQVDPVVPQPDRFSTSLERRRAQVAAVLDHQHEATGPTHAADRRRPEDDDVGLGNGLRELTSQLVHDGFVIEIRRGGLLLQPQPPAYPVLDGECEPSGAGRFSNSSRVMNIVPKFDPYAFKSNDWPVNPTVAVTPGVLVAISLICR